MSPVRLGILVTPWASAGCTSCTGITRDRRCCCHDHGHPAGLLDRCAICCWGGRPAAACRCCALAAATARASSAERGCSPLLVLARTATTMERVGCCARSGCRRCASHGAVGCRWVPVVASPMAGACAAGGWALLPACMHCPPGSWRLSCCAWARAAARAAAMSLMSRVPAAGRLGGSALSTPVALCVATTMEMPRTGARASMSVVSQNQTRQKSGLAVGRPITN